MKLIKRAFFIPVLLLILSVFGLFSLNAFAAETPRDPVYYVRFSGAGLNLYADASLSGEPIALLPDGAYVQILAGPFDSLAEIQVCDTGLKGYADMTYLKRLDAAVYDCDIYTYEEMQEDILLLQERYPALFHVNATGTSADGRTLYELVVGGSAAPKSILMHAGIHAREYANPYLLMEQLEQYLECYEYGFFRGKSYKELLDNVAIHIVPMVNPDGIAISQFGESAIRSSELTETVRSCYANDTSMRRTKSSYSDYLAKWKANARGTDLNRNFLTGFSIGAKVSIPSYAEYPGPSPFSEPETMFLGAVTLLSRPNVVINYHSSGEVAFWNTKENPYVESTTAFSNYMLSLVPYPKMRVGGASGSYLDWIFDIGNPVCSITFETGNAACPFAFEQYPKIWLQHSLVMRAAMEYAYTH